MKVTTYQNPRIREALENVDKVEKRTTTQSRKKRKTISLERPAPKFRIKKPACTSFEKALAEECRYFPLYALHTVNCVLNSKVREPYGEHELKGPLNAYVYRIVEQKAFVLKEFLLKVQRYREGNERARIHRRPKVNYGTRDASDIQIQREQEWNDYRESATKTSSYENLFRREKARGIKQRVSRASRKYPHGVCSSSLPQNGQSLLRYRKLLPFLQAARKILFRNRLLNVLEKLRDN